jgi:hypothetical protein
VVEAHALGGLLAVASTPSKRWVNSTSAASPRSRTPLMMSSTRWLTASSDTLSQLSR